MMHDAGHHISLLPLLLIASLVWSVVLADDTNERVVLWGDATTKWSSSSSAVDVSAFKAIIISLDTLVESNKVPESIHLPKGVQSIQLILSPSNTFSVNDPLFPAHRPSTQLYVRYQPNFSKQTINHTELANFIGSVFPSFPSANTSKMGPISTEMVPLNHQSLRTDPFTHVYGSKSNLAGYLKSSPPSSQIYSTESVFASGNSGHKSFLSQFFSGHSTDFVQSQTEWGPSFIDMQITLATSGKYQFSFVEAAGVVGGSTSRKFKFPTKTNNSKFGLSVVSSPSDIWTVEQNADGIKEGSQKIDLQRDTTWKVAMKRTIEKQGYHRDLVTELTIQGKPHSQQCNAILLEHFSNDVYVDYDQMSEYKRFGGHAFVLYSHVDVEVTAFNPAASHFVLFVKQPFTSDGTPAKVNISVPIHMRYQTPQFGATSLPVQIHPPEVYVQCDDATTQPHATSDTELPYLVRRPSANGVALEVQGNPVITINVPTGKLEDVPLVSVGTAAATLGATAFILYEIFGRRKSESERKRK